MRKSGYKKKDEDVPEKVIVTKQITTKIPS
jgi:hypothetical protein